MKKTILLIIAVLLPWNLIFSQDGIDPKISVKFDIRFDGNYTSYNKNTAAPKEDEAGFVGRYFKLLVNGKISDKFSYSFRHRMYLDNGNVKEFFGSTDWAYLTYHFNDRFSLSAGKQIVPVGGYEYDCAPIDMYFWSDFWNNVKPYQIGLTLGYTSPNQKHTIKFQLSNSPFSSKALANMFAYNVIWYGQFGCFKPIYSVNLMEYEKGHYINYISLGNKFTFNKFAWEFDYMNRAATDQAHYFSDFSIVSRVAYDINDRFSVFAKGGYDQNKAQDPGVAFVYDRYVLPGVQYGFYGAGVEYFPIRKMKNTVRIHAFWYSNNADPTPQSFNIGLRWQMKVWER